MISIYKTPSFNFKKIVRTTLIDLPSPSNIFTLWNFGFLLGICLILQIVRGLFLAIHYSCDIRIDFNSVSHISRDINFGWALRLVQTNVLIFFILCFYTHIDRGIYYGSYNFELVWINKVKILLLIIATAFLGYVLPWGQISTWGATAITNLFSAISYLGVIPVRAQAQICLTFMYIVILGFFSNKVGKKIIFRWSFSVIYYRIIFITGFQPILLEKNFLEIVWRIPGDANNPGPMIDYDGIPIGRENLPGHIPSENQFLWDWNGPRGRPNPHSWFANHTLPLLIFLEVTSITNFQSILAIIVQRCKRGFMGPHYVLG